MLNQINLVGRVVEGLSVECTPKGTALATFKVVTNGRKSEAPQFHNVRAFGALAVACAKHLVAGQLVAVSGRMAYNKWVDNRYRDEDGNPLHRVQAIVISNNVQFGVKAKQQESK